MAGTLIIHAVNVHQGGGARLLQALLDDIGSGRRVVLNVDSRMPLPERIAASLEVRRIKKSVFSRLCAEIWLFRHAERDDDVLCFGNLPPLLRVKAFTSVFVQNRYLIDDVGLGDLKVLARLRIVLERCWLRWCMAHVDQFLVQTPSMKQRIRVVVKPSAPVLIAPLVESRIASRSVNTLLAPTQLPNFVYVASGEGHKNHRNLLEAWCLLAIEGIRPSLVLTVDESCFSDLCTWMTEKIKRYGLNATNLGTVGAAGINNLYELSDVLIYPSQLESFGLPLIEASAFGLDVVASELDFVRDVVQPVQTFDPNSALSIARAVKRYCGYHDSMLRMLSPEQFLGLIQRGVN